MFATTKTASASGGVGPSDPNFNAVTLLLHGDGTNGAQNNTFIDSSTNNFTISRAGAATQGSLSPFSRPNGYWSAYFTGTTNYATLSSNTPMSFGTGAFTIEAWVLIGDRSVSVGASRTILGNSGNGYTMQLYIDSTNGRLVFGNTGSTNIQGTSNIANNVWHHIVVVRNAGGDIAIFVDGVRESVSTNGQNYASSTIYIGAFDAGNGFWNGYISNLRIVNGSAVYSPTLTTLTVPTTPLTAITNTALLTLQSNRLVDNSASALTVTGTAVSSPPFNPFNPPTAYSTLTNGGSVYLNGTTDYLAFPSAVSNSVGSGAFTVEFWINAPSNNDKFILGGRQTSAFIITTGGSASTVGTLRYSGASTFTSTKIITDNTWHHCAVVRNGTTVTLYVDGVADGSGTDGNTYSTITGSWTVGRNDNFDSNYFNGYISGFRFLKGTALYTANFTPPTAPPTVITNTAVLLNFTNAGIFDNAAFNDLVTVGGVQISTAVKKYGTGSIFFNGTNAGLTMPYNPVFSFGTGPFTLEAWVNFSALTGNHLVFDTFTSGADGGGYQFYWRSTGQAMTFYANGAVRAQSAFTTHTTGTWYHVACTRDSAGGLRIFVDGVLQVVVTYAAAINIATTAQPALGFQRTTGTNFFSGYIDEARVTTGVARYTANFTPPTLPFPDR